MELDYSLIGKRIAQRRKELGLRQVEVCERATSIPSLEVVIKLALALDTTSDTFLTGSVRYESDEWRDVAEIMRAMNPKQLTLAKSFLTWLSEQSM